jgi:hypothetical protein
VLSYAIRLCLFGLIAMIIVIMLMMVIMTNEAIPKSLFDEGFDRINSN